MLWSDSVGYCNPGLWKKWAQIWDNGFKLHMINDDLEILCTDSSFSLAG